MAEEKIICSNCGKDCSSHYFIGDDIDENKEIILCADCTSEYLTQKQWDKDKRIAELEEELKQWKDGTIIVKWTNAENKAKELEEENKQRAYVVTTYRKDIDNYIETIEELKKENDELKQENAKLQEQLKTRTWEVEELMHERKRLENDYMKLQEQLKKIKPPKFKYRQIVYAVAITDILKGQIDVFDFYEKKYLIHFYGIDDVNCLGDEWCYEKELFATEAEAQKYLEERK